ncbi:BTB/POZ domain-containing protein At5g48510-like [Raphanus sativus]|uniref:BTB/POZ domain-containing protein At5g48510-like n=1 Tax=Raphanus sativus TaxID=3726 RepID=A0A9W3C7L2_RAPSA|nr:BTB/POZ domain-containing protein At5g48510-like [Raphanus sativus]
MATQTNKQRFTDGLAKVLEEQWQVDVRLRAGVDNDDGSFISVHKLILASRSEVFKMMLDSDDVKTEAKKMETITLSEMRNEELKAFVEFMYSDGTMLSPKSNQHILVIAMVTQTNQQKFSGGLAKVLEEQWQVDVRLKAGVDNDDVSAISVHKLILVSRSEVFKRMLESAEVKTLAEQVETVALSEMKKEELEAFVEFMYNDGTMLSPKSKQHVRSLYLAADKYEIPHLRDLCRNEIISSLDLSNALDCLELAQIPFDNDLHEAAFLFVKTNIYTIASSEVFKLFVVSNPNLAWDIMKASLSCPSHNFCGVCTSCSNYCNYC